MPQTIPLYIERPGETRRLVDHVVATEEELLEFVNKARAAGGANVLDALLPSIPGEAEECLIAVGLNFGCSVSGNGDRFANGVLKWHMELPYNMPFEQAKTIAEALECPLAVWTPTKYECKDDRSTLVKAGRYVEVTEASNRYGLSFNSALYILLPEPIGNAALAFDEGKAFENYIDDPYRDEDCEECHKDHDETC